MGQLTRRGQRRIRFTKESDSSKRTVISAIEKLAVSVVVYEARGTLDRNSLEAADRKSIATALRSGGGHALAYEHVSPSEHAALWISDAVAWRWHRGGDWRRRVSTIVSQVRIIR